MDIAFNFNRRLVRSRLLWFTGLVVLMSLALQYLRGSLAAISPSLVRFSQAFVLGHEQGLGTWFGSLLLAGCAGLAVLVGAATRQAGGSRVRQWFLLAAVFLVLSIDEAIRLHEHLGPAGAAMLLAVGLQPTGALTFTWIAPAAALVAVFAVAYFRFLLQLPRGPRLLVLAAAVLYVGGAAGMEMIEAAHTTAYGPGPTLTTGQVVMRVLIIHGEETLEMLGLIVFAEALMRLLAGTGSTVLVAVRPTAARLQPPGRVHPLQTQGRGSIAHDAST